MKLSSTDLPAPGRTHDHGVADIALVQLEAKGRRAGRLGQHQAAARPDECLAPGPAQTADIGIMSTRFADETIGRRQFA